MRVSKFAHPSVHVTSSHFRAFPPFDVHTEQFFKPGQEHHHQLLPFFLDVIFRKNIVGKIVVSVSVCTISCVNHMEIPYQELCAKFQDNREDKS